MDWEKVSLLLDVIHKAASAGPKYKWIVDGADGVLDTMKNQAMATPIPPTEHHMMHGAEPANTNIPEPEPAA